MIVDETSHRQFASAMGRLLAGGLVLGLVWVLSRQGANILGTGEWSGMLPEALRQDGPFRVWASFGLLAVLSGILARAVLPRHLAPGLPTSVLAGVLALGCVQSLSQHLDYPIPDELSLPALGITAGATLLFLLAGRLVARV